MIKSLMFLGTLIMVGCNTTPSSPEFMVSCLASNGMPMYLGKATHLKHAQNNTVEFEAKDGPQTGMTLTFVNIPCVFAPLPKD